MKILLISSSARGHAIADALSRSPQKPEIISICQNRNPGLLKLSSALHVGNIMDFPWVLEIAQRTKPDFAFIGPDDPIGAGLADELENIGIKSVAPKKSLAKVESSKGFTRDLLLKYGIDANPKFRVFTLDMISNGALEQAKISMYEFMDKELHGQFVVKYDALKGGKGVRVSGEHLGSIGQGIAYALDCIEECGRVVIEEKLIGIEFSLMSFVSGENVIDMPAVQDHKRAYEKDTGPNTGGMGAYTDANHSLPYLERSDIARAKEINRLTAVALMKECGEPYTGILYGGFIAVKDGVRVIEYNARFGDPEALNVLPLMQSDFVAICQSIIDGTLTDDLVYFEKKATVCKYITPLSYPEAKTERAQEVIFPTIPGNARLYYGDVIEENGKTILGGSRSAGIVGIGDTIDEAERIAQSLCTQVQGPVRFRKDVGTAKLIQERITTIQSLRN